MIRRLIRASSFIIFHDDFGGLRKINFRGDTISILFRLNQIYIFHIYGITYFYGVNSNVVSAGMT